MLVLSRRVNETIVFPELGITIEILNSFSSKTRVGITAPASIRILRGELLEPNQWADSELSDTTAISNRDTVTSDNDPARITSIDVNVVRSDSACPADRRVVHHSVR